MPSHSNCIINLFPLLNHVECLVVTDIECIVVTDIECIVVTDIECIVVTDVLDFQIWYENKSAFE